MVIVDDWIVRTEKYADPPNSDSRPQAFLHLVLRPSSRPIVLLRATAIRLMFISSASVAAIFSSRRLVVRVTRGVRLYVTVIDAPAISSASFKRHVLDKMPMLGISCK